MKPSFLVPLLALLHFSHAFGNEITGRLEVSQIDDESLVVHVMITGQDAKEIWDQLVAEPIPDECSLDMDAGQVLVKLGKKITCTSSLNSGYTCWFTVNAESETLEQHTSC